jgi:phosphatidylglycerophosphate synthase
MPSANPTIEHGRHGIRQGIRLYWTRLARVNELVSLKLISPEKLLVLANALSLARGIAAIALFTAGLAGASATALVAIASPMWITDFADGRVARKGHNRGLGQRIDGAALDPLMDDLGFIAGYLVLLAATAIPLWFVGALLGSRVLFALIRLAGLAQDPEQFAFSDPVTKTNGAALAIGQVVLLAHLMSPHFIVGTDRLAVISAVLLTVTNTCAVLYFAIGKHGRVIGRLLRIP